MPNPRPASPAPPPVVVDTSRSPCARLRPVPLSAVSLADAFWSPRLRVNREVVIPSQYEHCEQTGRIDNFRRASGKRDLPFQGIYFNDSDVYKWLEAASWALAASPDPEIERMVDAVIAEVADAQRPDGYLNTYFARDLADERWTNLRDKHELYCAGHLFQAAVAHHRATGGDRLLAVATAFADHICDTFGPEDQGKREETDGHEEIEMALVELFRETGERRYLEQAQFFLDVRGRGAIGGSPYHQDHAPFREMEEIVGHAVRAVYLNAGAADLYAEEGDEAVLGALRTLWANMIGRRMYVSGGIGARYEGEAFGEDFELPNARAYAETCAAIGSGMWNWRMLALHGEARYADLLELALYNGVLPGLSLDGRTYFYQNPLADDGTHRRQAWFGCACCPPNVARLLASLPGYFYTVSEDGVQIHLYAEGAADLALPDGSAVRLRQRTTYPWDGEVSIEVDGSGTFAMDLRIPAWCERGAELEVNGRPFEGAVLPGSYVAVRRAWRPGDIVRLTLPMPVRMVESHPHVLENNGRVALMRGPLLYCVEAADNPGLDPRDVILRPDSSTLGPAMEPDTLGGVVVLRGQGEVASVAGGWEGVLYRSVGAGAWAPERRASPIAAIPYYAWANREPGPMRVWLRTG